MIAQNAQCNTSEHLLKTIAIVQSPYKEKFAIPRQPGLVNAAKGQILLQGDANNADLVKELAQFSHIWLLFIFHGTQQQGWKPLVRPPRLGGNKKIGVLATRSTFRPNPIGMSVVKLDRVELMKSPPTTPTTSANETKKADHQVILHISNFDLLDNTPIIDIKPYIPYSDALTHADGGYAQVKPENNIQVTFSPQAELDLQPLTKNYSELTLFIQQVLEQDPRPAYKQGKEDNKIYGMNLYDLNIQWQMIALHTIEVLSIKKITRDN
ncbi:MAG: tRNA (N6-threonylcarbamoyladenosine(37)-N6)-methyltransferase TrmO [Colwellia sp.]